MQNDTSGSSQTQATLPTPEPEKIKSTRLLRSRQYLRDGHPTRRPQYLSRTRRPYPCPVCNSPVASVAIDGFSPRIVDTVRIGDEPCNKWTANILEEHDCHTYPLFGSSGLRQVIADSKDQDGCLLHIRAAFHCDCGTLVCRVRIGFDPPSLYDCHEILPPDSDRSTADGTRTTQFFARLNSPHVCLFTGILVVRSNSTD